MNAGGVDKACKSNGLFISRDWDYIKVKGRLKLVANEVVIHRNLPLSREQRTERCANTRWSPRGKVLTLREEPVKYQLVGSVMDYQGYDA